VLVALTALVKLANAEHASATVIVFETYEGRRPEKADFPMGMLRQEFDRLGYIASPPQVQRLLGNQLALPGSEPPIAAVAAASSGRQNGRSSDKKTRPPSNPRWSAAALLKELSNVHERWLAAKESFDILLPALSKAVSDAFASPALIVADQTIRNKLQSVVLDLALINDKLAHTPSDDSSEKELAKRYQEAADDWMAEWIRTYGSEGITQKKNGPDADDLYTRVRDARDKLGRGVLSITVDDPNVQLYVNETIRSLRHPVTDLSPGRYRGLMMGPNDDARLFRLEVLPNQTTRLTVDWSVSSSLVVSEWSVALVFLSATHPDPAVLACKLARFAGQSGVVLLGMEMVEKNWRATASLYSVQSGQVVRAGYTTLGSGELQKSSAALAQFIVNGITDPDVIVTAENLVAAREFTGPPPGGPIVRSTHAVDSAAPAATSRGLGKWFAAGGATAALGLGGYGLYRYYTCGTVGDNCSDVYPRSGIIGYGAAGVGIALGALASYWFYEDSNATSASRVTMVPLHSGAMASWAAEF
jgi:hypothetical protein